MTLPREIDELIAKMNNIQNAIHHQKTVEENRRREMDEAISKINELNASYLILKRELTLALQDEP